MHGINTNESLKKGSAHPNIISIINTKYIFVLLAGCTIYDNYKLCKL